MATLIYGSSQFSEWQISTKGDLSLIPRPRARIEVVIPAYNSAAWIEECMDSIDRQDCLEALTVTIHDDGSTDQTADMVRQHLLKSGLSATLIRRTGNSLSTQGGMFYRQLLESSISDYVAILDSDDLWLSSDKLSKQLAAMDANPKASLSFHDFAVVEDLERRDYRVHPSRFWVERYKHPFSLGAENFIGASTVMARSSALKALRWDGYDALAVGDLPIWLALRMRGVILYCPDVLGLYRIRPGSLSAKRGLASSLLRSRESLKWALKGSTQGLGLRIGWSIFGSLPVKILSTLLSRVNQRRVARYQLLELLASPRPSGFNHGSN